MKILSKYCPGLSLSNSPIFRQSTTSVNSIRFEEISSKYAPLLKSCERQKNDVNLHTICWLYLKLHSSLRYLCHFLQIHIPLPPKIDPSVTMMQVEEKPDVTYSDVGGCKEQIEKLREVVETPLLHPERFVNLGIEPPKGVLLYGPPGTGKTLCARAVANRTDACFIRVIGSELVQKYVGEGARMVRELFEMARTKKACLIFFDEIDAVGGARFDDGAGGDNEVQRTMLELINQLDGFDPRGNIKVLMATNRPDTLDPALMRPGRLDRKVEFGLPDLEGRANIFKIHARSMSVERDIRYDLLARLCPNSTGAEIRSVCTEAGMFAIRSRRKVATEKDFIDAVNKVIKAYAKFSATPKYMTYN